MIVRGPDGEERRIDAAHIGRLIEVVQQLAPHRVPLFQAAAKGIIGLCDVPRGEPFPHGLLKALSRPVVAVIGDDDYRSTGPSGFPAAKRFAYWAKASIVHATGGEVKHYEEAVNAAVLCFRLLLVETDAAHGVEWRRFLGDGRRIPILAILPCDGVHPVKPGTVQ
jgi:hypothetical protein